mgnify:FL=1
MKKYIHPSLKKKVPKELRLEIYKKALDFYITGGIIARMKPKNAGLCMLLPCILWNLEDYLDGNPNDDSDWSYHDTQIAFPEITKRIIYKVRDNEDTVKKRIKILKRIIKRLENI